MNLTGIERGPTNVHQALTTLSAVAACFREDNDARAVFPDVYAIVTRRVLAAIEGRAGPKLQEPEALSRLAGRFAEQYLDSVEASLLEALQVRAWQIAHDEADAGRLLPLQDAFLGINAHVNHDLAIGIAEILAASGRADDEAYLGRCKHDYDAINEILEAALPECMKLMAERYDCPAARAILAVPFGLRAFAVATLRLIGSWRARVWGEMRELLRAPTRVERRTVRRRIDRRAGHIAGLVSARWAGAALPTPGPRAAARMNVR